MEEIFKAVPACLLIVSCLVPSLSPCQPAIAKGAPGKKAAVYQKAAGAAAPRRPQNVDMTASFNAYVGRLRTRVQNHWYIPDGKNHVVLTAVVNQDGSVTGLSLTSTPDNGAAQQAASDAFNQSQPLESLPSGCQAAKLTLTFESSADPHGDSQSNLGSRLEPINLKQAQPAASSN